MRNKGWAMRYKLGRLLALLAWKIKGSPRETALPVWHPFRDADGYKLIGYEEFPLDDKRKAYLIESDKFDGFRRRIYLFETSHLSEDDKA